MPLGIFASAASPYLFNTTFRWAESARARRDKDNGDLLGYEVTWLLEGLASPSGSLADQDSAVAALIAAAEGDDISFYLRSSDTATASVLTRGELSVNNTEHGVRSRVQIVDDALNWTNGVKCQVEVMGFIPGTTGAASTTGVIAHEYTIEYDEDAHQILRQTQSGKVVTTDSTSAAAKASALQPSIPSGMVRDSRRFTTNEDDNECEYQVVFREYHKAPPGIDPTANANRTTRYEGWKRIYSVRARVVGIDGNSIGTVQNKAESLADGLAPGGASRRVTREVEVDEYRNQVSISDEWEEATDGTYLAYQETLRLTIDYGHAYEPERDGAGGRWFAIKVLPTRARMTQAGSQTTLSPLGPPRLAFPELKLDREDRGLSVPLLDDQGTITAYERSWSYEGDLSHDIPEEMAHPLPSR